MENYKNWLMENLPLRFCTGGFKCPYNLLKSIPYTENGSDTNNIYQINLDIFVVFFFFLRFRMIRFLLVSFVRG